MRKTVVLSWIENLEKNKFAVNKHSKLKTHIANLKSLCVDNPMSVQLLKRSEEVGLKLGSIKSYNKFTISDRKNQK